MPNRYDYTRNDPYDRNAPIVMVIPQKLSSVDYMRQIRGCEVPKGSVAMWFLGQNGFILKAEGAPLIAIDPYLTNECARLSKRAFRSDRQLPVFIEPEDLDVDVVLTTHSHDDHADKATLRRLPKKGPFIGPWQSYLRYLECGVPADKSRLIHPKEVVELDGVKITGEFALPTDNTDLNHMGMLFEFASGIRIYDTGDCGYSDLLPSLMPHDVDVCMICMNGGYHNLSHMDAARIVKATQPKVAIPAHYDMMVGNVSDPEMMRTAMDVIGAGARFHQMEYYEPWIYSG